MIDTAARFTRAVNYPCPVDCMNVEAETSHRTVLEEIEERAEAV